MLGCPSFARHNRIRLRNLAFAQPCPALRHKAVRTFLTRGPNHASNVAMQDEPQVTGESSFITGGSIPDSDNAAYRALLPADLPAPVVIAAPHGGRVYPDSLTRRMRRPDYSALRLEDRHIDTLALAVAERTGACLLAADAPRAMLDLNRASDDVDWEMVAGGAPANYRKSLANRRSRSGLGLVPRRLAGLGEIWTTPLTRAELKARVSGVHQPYHRMLGKMLESVRDRWGAALLVDLHSMPPLKRRFPDEKPAEFVLGDRFGASCDSTLAARGLRFFGNEDRPVAHNRPYAGGYVLDRHAQPARGIHAIQLEVCRSTYLDAALAEPSARLPAVAKLLAGFISDMAAGTASLARDNGLPLAAE